MRNTFQLFLHDPGIGLGDDQDPTATSSLTTIDDHTAPLNDTAGIVAPPDDPPPPETVAQPPPLEGGDGADLAISDLAYDGAAAAAAAAASPSDVADINAAQILRDRPDVFAAFYREFYGPNNDHHSQAWVNRVGGETAEDYARYWYGSYGRSEGYTQSAGSGLGAPAEGDAPAGRTTLDGIPLSKILSDRPDVFQAFFTEYYGEHNDRHSDAWVQRVGGASVEDYANYWYNAYGKVQGYHPSAPSSPAQATDDGPAPDPVAPATTDPAIDTDPSLDPWNHPALFPDWQPPYPGWEPPTAGSTGSDGAAPSSPSPEAPSAPAEPFFYSDPGSPMLPILPGQSLFGGDG